MKGADQCPKCGSRKWAQGWQQIADLAATTVVERSLPLDAAILKTAAESYFGARHVRLCKNCGTAWEFFDEADLLDDGVRLSSFKEPCNNCAFRPGSAEQKDPVKWRELLDSLDLDPVSGWPRGKFFCHKGVPLDPQRVSPSDSGFAYPYKNGNFDIMKNRPCRGFLRMWHVKSSRFCRAEIEAEETEHAALGLGHA